MTEIYLARTLGGTLKPIDGQGEEYLAELGMGEIVRAVIKKDRNPGHHRKFYGLLRMVYQNQEKYLSMDGLLFAVKIQAGYVDEIRLAGDKIALRPRSIAWSKMDQGEFKAFYEASLRAIKELLPQFADVDLDRELTLSGDV